MPEPAEERLNDSPPAANETSVLSGAKKQADQRSAGGRRLWDAAGRAQRGRRFAALGCVLLAFGQVARSQTGREERDVAAATEPGVRVEYSSFLFRSKKADEQIPCPVNEGTDAHDAIGPCQWRSNRFQHLPQWVWIHFGGMRRIDRVVLRAADPATLESALTAMGIFWSRGRP